MAAYDDFVEVVTEMMQDYGGPAIFVSNAQTEYDPSTGKSVTTPNQFNVSILAFDFLQKKDGYGGMNNSLVRSGDKQVYMQSGPLVPIPNAKTDTIIFNGSTFNIITVKSLNPSGSSVVVTEMFIRE